MKTSKANRASAVREPQTVTVELSAAQVALLNEFNPKGVDINARIAHAVNIFHGYTRRVAGRATAVVAKTQEVDTLKAELAELKAQLARKRK